MKEFRNYNTSVASDSENELIAELLRKSRELQDYVDNAVIGLHWVDGNGMIKWANKAELEMLGYSEKEYIGHHISEFHVEEAKINDILTRLSCNQTLTGYESVLRCKDGSTKTVLISSNVFWDDGKFVHTRCFTIDVSEQKRLFEALKESEARYKNLINVLPAGIYTCNKDGKITFYNDLAAKMWGYHPNINEDSLKFCPCAKVWLMDGTYIAPEESPMAVTLKTGKPVRNIEAKVGRPDGSTFYACLNIDPLLDENNEVIGAINVFQDITTLKETELALRESESRYRNLIQGLETPLYTTDSDGRITMYN